MKIAIHQPNFIPWYPFFHKMQHCDIFVLLNHCQFEKNNYQNRFHIGDTWYTCRVDKSSGSKASIYEKKYVDFVSDWKRIKSSLPKEHREFADSIDSGYPEEMFGVYENSVANINGFIIDSIRKMYFPHAAPLYVDYPTDLTGTDRLIDIVKRFGGTTYISGPTGSKYMDMWKWEDVGIEVQTIPDTPYKLPLFEYLNDVQYNIWLHKTV